MSSSVLEHIYLINLSGLILNFVINLCSSVHTLIKVTFSVSAAKLGEGCLKAEMCLSLDENRWVTRTANILLCMGQQ